jgi:hypothetical protein
LKFRSKIDSFIILIATTSFNIKHQSKRAGYEVSLLIFRI